MAWCELTDLSKYVLQAYLDKIEELNPGSAGGHIDQVSAEIDEALLQGGRIPTASGEDPVSAALTRICSVMAAWRCVGNLTSLMDTEASSANEWLPLQKLNSRAEKDLDAVRAGKLDPFPGEGGEVGISVVTNAPLFPASKWDGF